jgi:hypothetical protein
VKTENVEYIGYGRHKGVGCLRAWNAKHDFQT